MANSYKRLGVNTFWVFIGNIGPRLVSFLLMPLYTFWLSPEDFGVQDIILVYSTLLIPYITLGLYESVFIFPKGKNKSEQSSYLSTCLVLSLSCFTLFLFGIFLLSDNALKTILPDKLFEFRYLLLVIIFTQSLQRITQFFLRGIDRMRDFSMSGVIYAIVLLVVGISLVPKYGINGYWLSLISADVTSILYISYRVRIIEYFNFRLISKGVIVEMLKYSIPLIPNATMWWVVNSINRPILVSSVGLDGVGLYAVAGKFPSILSVLFAIFFSSFQISAIEEFNKESFESFYNKVFKIQLFLQILVVIFFELFGGLVFHLFIDEKYYAAIDYLPIFCFGVLLSNVSVYLGVCFTVIKKTKYMLYSAIVAAVVAVITNYLLIPSLGIYGACVSVLLSQFAMLLYRYCTSSKIAKIFIDRSVIVQIALLATSLLVFYFVKDKPLVYCLITLLLLMFSVANIKQIRMSCITLINIIKNRKK